MTDMATSRKKKTSTNDVWPKVQSGSHLNVITYEDGSVRLEWDDDALLQEVRDAIASVELAKKKPAVRAKVATRKKPASTKKTTK